MIDTAERARVFSTEVVRIYRGLSRSFDVQQVARQLFRSSTSVGAHMAEAVRSRSNAELVSKIECALQELQETSYWLVVLAEAGALKQQKADELLREADELTAILVASVKTIKARHLRK